MRSIPRTSSQQTNYHCTLEINELKSSKNDIRKIGNEVAKVSNKNTTRKNSLKIQ
jgi:hypothetical protein